jgi:hypothetical protein
MKKKKQEKKILDEIQKFKKKIIMKLLSIVLVKKII